MRCSIIYKKSMIIGYFYSIYVRTQNIEKKDCKVHQVVDKLCRDIQQLHCAARDRVRK